MREISKALAAARIQPIFGSGQIGNIGHDAHLGGAVIGLAVTTIMYPSIVSQSLMLYLAVIGLTVTMLLLLYFHPLHLPGHTYQPVWNKPKPSKRKNNITDEPDKKPTDEEVIERLLDKVSKRGIDSLTYVEKSQLEAISRKRKQQEQSKNQKDLPQV